MLLECLVVSVGLASLLRLCEEEDRDKVILNRPLDLGIVAESGGSLSSYRPVSGSAFGALLVISGRGTVVEAMKSLPESLSRSMTVKEMEYDCS